MTPRITYFIIVKLENFCKTNEYHLKFDVDMSSKLCMWTANVLEHRYIHIILSRSEVMIPNIFLALMRLMGSAHVLYKKKPKLYLNRRPTICHSIWRLLQQLVINHEYIRVSKPLSETYIGIIVDWLMKELKILSSIKSEDLRSSLDYDYIGGIIVLMTLVANKQKQEENKHCTNYSDCQVNYKPFWMNVMHSIHSFTHDTE